MKKYITITITIFFFAVFASGECYEPKGKKSKAKYDLAICALFQNEANYMKEWIEFHKLAGVQHFYLYNDQSEDDYMTVLKPYIDSGVVDLFECAKKKDNSLDEFSDMQSNTYMDCIKKFKNQVKWIAFIDLDEFLFPTQQKDLKVFLKSYDKYPAVAVNWQMFGTSGVEQIPEGKLMIETLVNQAVEGFEKNHWVKLIVQPKQVKKCHNAHLFYFRKKQRPVNSAYSPVKSFVSDTVFVNDIRINHYYTRDNHHLVTVKTPRRLQLSSSYQAWLDEVNQMNEVFSDAIFPYIPELQKKMGFK
ncbi:MAG: glycosyltransferase family 92 protein [Chlamydiota bacterium]|nr:glycosyltransferase family 92 protein [Chlamydiota bacterium]